MYGKSVRNFFGCIFWAPILFKWYPNTSGCDTAPPPPLPPTNKLFSCYYPIKTSFIALAIAPVPFLFNSILFVQTGHANFDFN